MKNLTNIRFLKWLGLIVLIILLVVAAFVGGQLLNGRGNPLGAGGGELAGDSFEPREVSVVPAEELPRTPPDESGTFIRREDNSLFIGIGNNTGDGDAPVSGESSEGGLMVEVIVNGETVVYQEVIDLDLQITSDEIRQEVTKGTIEEIADGSHIWVWGQKTGDRIIAEVLLYTLPMIKPGTVP